MSSNAILTLGDLCITYPKGMITALGNTPCLTFARNVMQRSRWISRLLIFYATGKIYGAAAAMDSINICLSKC